MYACGHTSLYVMNGEHEEYAMYQCMTGYDGVIIPQDKLQQRNADRRAAKARAGNRADNKYLVYQGKTHKIIRIRSIGLYLTATLSILRIQYSLPFSGFQVDSGC